MTRSERKLDHIRHALATSSSGKSVFSDVSFIPNSLPNTSYVNTSLATELCGVKLESPVMINAMTGGAEQVTTINQKLSILAREKKLAMAVGSQMAALRDPTLLDSYTIVRKENPNGVVFANLGAEATLEQAKRAVHMLEANMLQIHLNVMQELLMPEGDRDFRGYLDNIEKIVQTVGVPVIVKEVGFGMSRDTMTQLWKAGVHAIDVGGSGGTNFAKVENRRHNHPLDMFESWGINTVQSLLETHTVQSQGAYIASGGIQHGLDVVKAISLGASAVGIAGLFLRKMTEKGLEQALLLADDIHQQIRIAMTALGVHQLVELTSVPVVISGETERWAWLRGIDCRQFCLRKREK